MLLGNPRGSRSRMSVPASVRKSSPPAPRGTCYLSRKRGWIDPEDPRRPTYEVNLLAIALGAPVWSLGTAWKTLFRSLIPLDVEDAYRRAMVRSRLSDRDVQLLTRVADRLRVRLVVRD